MAQLSIRGGEGFYRQMIECLEEAIDGRYGMIGPGPDSEPIGPHGVLFHITFLPAEADDTSFAIFFDGIDECPGSDAWEAYPEHHLTG